VSKRAYWELAARNISLYGSRGARRAEQVHGRILSSRSSLLSEKIAKVHELSIHELVDSSPNDQPCYLYVTVKLCNPSFNKMTRHFIYCQRSYFRMRHL